MGYTNTAASIVLAGTATVSDVDSANFNAGKLTVRATTGCHWQQPDRAGRHAVHDRCQQQRASQRGGHRHSECQRGRGYEQVRGDLQRQRHGGDSCSNSVRALRFRTISNASTANRVLSFTLTDGDGGTSATRTKMVNMS